MVFFYQNRRNIHLTGHVPDNVEVYLFWPKMNIPCMVYYREKIVYITLYCTEVCTKPIWYNYDQVRTLYQTECQYNSIPFQNGLKKGGIHYRKLYNYSILKITFYLFFYFFIHYIIFLYI